jgi:hypothetical protein
MAAAMILFTAGAEAGVETVEPSAVTDKLERQPDCLQETGSRIKPRGDKCIEAAGQVLTREELERTGAVDTGEAIRRRVPAAR